MDFYSTPQVHETWKRFLICHFSLFAAYAHDLYPPQVTAIQSLIDDVQSLAERLRKRQHELREQVQSQAKANAQAASEAESALFAPSKKEPESPVEPERKV